MNAQAKFFEKLNQRSGTPKTARRSTCEAKQSASTASGTTQRTLFGDSPAPQPILSAEEQWYQRTCDELPPEQRDRFIRLVQQAAKG